MLSRAEVNQRLAAKLSPAAVERIAPWVRPGYRIQLGKKSPKLPLGASHFAGPADVPAGFIWPAARIKKKSKATRPLSLMAQINLAELPASLVDELPRDGWLLFFLDHFDSVWGGHDEEPDCYRTVYIKAGECSSERCRRGCPNEIPPCLTQSRLSRRGPSTRKELDGISPIPVQRGRSK